MIADQCMRIQLTYGDVFDYSGDVLICPANPQLNMSGGVNGEILRRGGSEIQAELWEFLKSTGNANAAPETVVTTSPGQLRFRKIIHAVAIDAFYETNRSRVARSIVAAWRLAHELSLFQVVMTAIGTGYGRLPMEEFGEAVSDAAFQCEAYELEVTLVVRQPDDMQVIDSAMRKSH
jgi:O-acetyl-ADP-ribose deacetylase